MPVKRKALRITSALKSAARRGSGRDGFSPTVGELPLVILRVQIVGCKNLLGKDRNGFSDPFVVASILNARHQTPVCKKTLSPSFPARESTFDFPLYFSLADKLGVLELVVWDKDMLKKDYLGEASLPLASWFANDRPYGFNPSTTPSFHVNLESTRAGTQATGSVEIRLGFVVPPTGVNHLLEFDEIYSEFVRQSRPSLVSAPPTEGVGTIRSRAGLEEDELEDDGGISSDSDASDEEEETTPLVDATPRGGLYTIYSPPQQVDTPIPPIDTSPELTPSTARPLAPAILRSRSSRPSSPGFSMPRMRFRRSLSSGVIPPLTVSAPVTPPATDTNIPLQPTPPLPTSAKKKRFRQSWSSSPTTPNSLAPPPSTPSRRERKKKPYSLTSTSNDILGIVTLSIVSASDLPKLSNMTRTGWDMDPFVIVSFGKKVFRTRVIRHSLNPIWDEKLLFHVRRYERGFKIGLTICDWDKLSSNDWIGETGIKVSELIDDAPQPDPQTGLYPPSSLSTTHSEQREFTLPIITSKETSHNPTITVRARYQPYAALRQQFWRIYLKQYDTDDTNTLSHLEITSMLDSLGSTLRGDTVNSFFTRFGKDRHREDLTMDEAIQCLESELGKPTEERKRLDTEEDSYFPDTPSVAHTPSMVLSVVDGKGRQLSLDELDFGSGPSLSDEMLAEFIDRPALVEASTSASTGSSPISGTSADESEEPSPAESQPHSRKGSGWENEDTLVPKVTFAERTTEAAGVSDPKPPKKTSKFRRSKKPKPVELPPSVGNGTTASTPPSPDPDTFERVINVRSCPLCHRPRLSSKAEMDIITHLAICASHDDYSSLNRIVVANFFTASQAQRKWYTKMIKKVGSGDYKLGANSANIIVQNRITGMLEEEKMQVYVRLGIRLLYKGAKSRMEGARARKLLKSLSNKQGTKYDSPESRREIGPFIDFHGLNVSEILEPLESFRTFNEFFYRKLKPSARPLESPNDPYRLVSSADCRFMAFATVSEATKLWIKGREFTIQKLLGERYKHEADKYTGGALCIFRLAPQDYHRFHSPVDGIVGEIVHIPGEYYTVNPQAIRTSLDVYGENARKIVPIDSPQFGRVMAVCVGAMMVGSIIPTVEEGQSIKRGEEFGYFAFGGSTIVMLFEKDKVEWDEDLLINGRASLETLTRVGMGIGTGFRPSSNSSS